MEIRSEDCQDLDDIELIKLYRGGNEEAFNRLLERYSNKISSIASRFYGSSLAYHDFFQEGAIGLFKATRKYQQERGASFHAFAEIHIRNQIINAIKSATRKKHSLLNQSISFDHPGNEWSDGGNLVEIICNHEPSPEEIVLRKFDETENKQKIDSILRTQLTKLEYTVLLKLCNGSSYNEAASDIGVAAKSIDNAFRRVKKKFAKVSPAELFA